MLITPAYAQAAGPAGAPDFIMSLVPFILIFAIMYFLLIRPQQKRMKAHKELVANLRRGDQVVTAGGLFAKVTKVIDDEAVEVQLGDNKVKMLRSMVQEVRSKSEPVNDN